LIRLNLKDKLSFNDCIFLKLLSKIFSKVSLINEAVPFFYYVFVLIIFFVGDIDLFVKPHGLR